MNNNQEHMKFLKELRTFIANQAQNVKSITLTAQFKDGKELAKEMDPQAFISLIDRQLESLNVKK